MTLPTTYTYRCTEQQLEAHLARVAESGDVVEHVIYKGGRDYVLVCQPAARVLTVDLSPESIAALAAAIGDRVHRSVISRDELKSMSDELRDTRAALGGIRQAVRRAAR